MQILIQKKVLAFPWWKKLASDIEKTQNCWWTDTPTFKFDYTEIFQWRFCYQNQNLKKYRKLLWLSKKKNLRQEQAFTKSNVFTVAAYWYPTARWSSDGRKITKFYWKQNF